MSTIRPEQATWALRTLDAAQGDLGILDSRPPHPVYRYEKHHLVPFGEFIPPLFRWFVALMNIPLGDFNRGALGQGLAGRPESKRSAMMRGLPVQQLPVMMRQLTCGPYWTFA